MLLSPVWLKERVRGAGPLLGGGGGVGVQGSRGRGRFFPTDCHERGYFPASNLEASGLVPRFRLEARRGLGQGAAEHRVEVASPRPGPCCAGRWVECARLLGAACEAGLHPFYRGLRGLCAWWGPQAPGQPGPQGQQSTTRKGRRLGDGGAVASGARDPRGPEMGLCLPL